MRNRFRLIKDFKSLLVKNGEMIEVLNTSTYEIVLLQIKEIPMPYIYYVTPFGSEKNIDYLIEKDCLVELDKFPWE